MHIESSLQEFISVNSKPFACFLYVCMAVSDFLGFLLMFLRFSFLYCFKHSLRKALWLVTFCWDLNKLVQLLKVSAGYSHCHLVFSLFVSAPGREGHFLYAGRAGLPQV